MKHSKHNKLLQGSSNKSNLSQLSIPLLLDNVYYPQANTGHQLQISLTANVLSVVEHSIKLTNTQL